MDLNQTNLTDTYVPANDSNASYYSSYDYSSLCYRWDTNNYVIAGLAILGVVTNTLNIIVFSQKNMMKNTMNVYLLAKSASDLYYMVGNALEPMSVCFNCFTMYLYWYQTLSLIYRYYICSVAQLSSMMLDVMATLNRYVTISQNFSKFSKRIDHRLIILGIYLFGALFYIYKFFVFTVTEMRNDSVVKEYYLDYSDFGAKIGHQLFDSIHTVIRDGICVLAIIVLNILIMIQMRRAMATKKIIGSHGNKASSSKIKARRAEQKITIMVILTGIKEAILHILLLVYYLPVPQFRDIALDDCYQDTLFFLYILSYSVNFFFYIFFNNNYRETFTELWFTCLRKCGYKPKSPTTTKGQTKFSNSIQTIDTAL